MNAQELVDEARSVARATGLPEAWPRHGRSGYAGRIRDVATGLADSAGGDRRLLQEAGRLALQDDVQRGGISSATIALRQAAALAVRLGPPAFDAAVLAEALTAGSGEGLGSRRLKAIAALTRYDPDVLAEAMDHVPTGIVSLAATPDAASVVRDVLLAAKEAAEGLRG